VPEAVSRAGPGPGRGTVQLLIGRACAIACGYAITVILARGLGPADYGLYGVILSVLLVTEMAAGLGIPGATIKLIPEHPGDAVPRTATFLLLVVSLVLFALLWGAAPLLARLFAIPDGAWLFRLSLVDLPLSGLLLAYQAALYGHRRFGAISMALVVYGLVKLGGIAVLLGLGLTLVGALLVNALATLGAVVYLAWRTPVSGLRPSYPVARTLLSLALPIGLYIVLVHSLLNVDLWVLKGVGEAPPAVVGRYVAALSIARVLGVVASVLTPVVYASVCSALARTDETGARRQLQAAVRFAIVVLAPACTLVALNGEEIMLLIYSEAYAGSGTMLGLLAAGFALLAVMDSLLYGAIAGGRHAIVVGFLAGLVTVAVVGDVILVGRLGALGAALGMATALAVGAAGAVTLAAARFGPIVPGATVLRVAAASLVLVAANPWLGVTGPWLLVKLGLLGMLYVAVLVALGELNTRDLGTLALGRSGAA
jgi:O-antigen/teichoic acid export membrane protein